MSVRAGIALALAVAACASWQPHPTCAIPAPSAASRPFLWQVSGPQGSIIVFGTHQAADPDDVIAAAWTALDRSDVFVAEAAEVPTGRGLASRYFYQPRGASLKAQLGDADFDTLDRIVDDVPRDVLDRLKPWVAFMRLAAHAYPFPSPNINAALLARARARHMRTGFLDSWDDQERYLGAAIGTAKLAAVLHRFPTIYCDLSRRAVAYRAGDDTVFINEIHATERPILERIDRWLVALERHADSGERVFVAIGIGQLLGPYGLLARLAADGYEVRRM